MFRHFRPLDPWIEHARDESGKDTVILVPGTWAHGVWNVIVESRLPGKLDKAPFPHTGRWFDPKGRIAQTIGLDAFNVHILRWSERNSVLDRREAATVLQSHLIECLRSNPDAEHYVIAHSHGGNIAAMAFSQMGAHESLRKIHFASMGTPFIWFQARDLSESMKQSVLVVIFVAYLIALGFGILTGKLLGALLPDSVSYLAPGLWHFLRAAFQWISGFIVFLLASTPVAPVAILDEKLPAVLTEAEQVSSSQTMERLGSVLLLQAPADEAWFGLTIPALAMWINRGIGWLLSRVWKPVIICGVVGLLTMTALIELTLHLAHSNPDSNPSELFLQRLEFASRVALWLLAIVPAQGLAWIGLSVLGGFTLQSLGYGFFEAVGLTVATEVHVEQYPAGGPWAIFCPSKRIQGFHHALYESPEVQMQLSKWLSRRKEQ